MSVLAILALALAAGEPELDRAIAEWDFSKEDPLGWRAAHDLAPLRFQDGALVLAIAGADPYAIGPEIAFETTPYQYILVDIESSVAGEGEIFWAEGADPGRARFGQEAKRGFPIAKGRRLAVVVPFWAPGRKVWRIRLDLPGKPGQSALVRRIAIRERIVDLPPPDDMGFEFERAEEAAWWMPLRDVEKLVVRRGSLVAEAAGPDPTILAPPVPIDPALHPYLSFRLSAPGGRGIAILLAREETGGFPPGLRAAVDLVPGPGARAYNIDLRSVPGLEGAEPGAKVRRIAIAAPGAQMIILDGIRAASSTMGPAEPCLVSVRPRGTVLAKGEPAEIDVEVRNVGGAPAEKLSIRAGFLGDAEGRHAIETIPPVGVARVRLPLRAPAEPGRHVLGVELAGPGVEPAPLERDIVVVDEVGPSARRPDSTRIVESGPLRLVIAGSGGQWTAGVLWLRRGEGWFRLGALSDLGRLQASAWTGPLSGTTATADGRGWVFRRPFPGFSCEIAFLPETPPVEGAGLIRVRLALTCERLLLRSLSLPSFGIGDGSFGAARRIALLPGLEYAIGGERTSGSEFCIPELASRVVPHPYKVTIPLAAVLAEGVAAGWIWDPLQESRPAVIFASPDFVRGEASHLALLAWPGVGEGREENEVVASAQRLLPSGGEVTIEGFLFGMAADDVDGPLSLWIARRGGLPEPPPIPFDYARFLDAVAAEVARIAWVEGEAKWHRALPDPWGPAFVEENALFLSWRLALPAPDPASPSPSDPRAFSWTGLGRDEGKTARDVFEKACRRRREEAPGASWGQDLAFHLGGVADAMRGMRARALSVAARIRPDGSIPFAPNPSHAVLGQAGDSSSGLTARAVLPIADYARRTGDPRAVEALRKALGYIDGCLRPEGAQTWELPLHVPDVLAAADAVALNVVAFEETVEEAYRAHARRWAFRGLPFIYLWNGDDRPIMRYGSIPVFGATWYTSPWFGRIVQWNGLVYAQALLELARIDRTADWALAARGIVHSAIAQARPLDPAASPLRQRVPDCGHTGMYCDAYSAVEGTDAYHWCLSGMRIVEVLARLEGDSPWPQTAAAESGGVRIRVTAPGRWIERPRAEGGVLRFALRIAAAGPRWILIAGAKRPSAVALDGEAIPESPDAADAPPEAWKEDPSCAVRPAWRVVDPEGWLIIRIAGGGERRVEVRYAG